MLNENTDKMKKDNYYLASADVARRAGVISSSYRTKEGKFILSEKDLRTLRFQMTAEEYVTGFDVEMITPEEAAKKIKANKRQIGEEKPAVTETTEQTEVAQTEGTENETETGNNQSE